MQESIFFKRYSKRSYLDKPITKESLERIFEIVRWTPSCANKQPWRVIFVQNKQRHEKLSAALSRGNEWAAKAPVLVVVCAREADDYSREDDPVKYYQFDSGMATLSLLLGAVQEGLMGHPMAGYDAAGVKTALDIPDEYHVLCVISLGYEGSVDQLDERTRKKDEAPRTRKDIVEIISFDNFDF
ncbi:MAG: nitroreductase family protein [Candidatus Zixiibacteriota bacterium]|nr:MAG: nitroreductase family protein [candidate division Zixibacteria bacterium]